MGEHLRSHLTARGEAFRSVSSRTALSDLPDVDLLEQDEGRIAAALAGVRCIYFTAGVAHEAAVAGDAALMRRVNVEAPVTWLQAADRAGVSQFVWLSSIKVLGDRAERPLAVNDPYQPGDDYARSKVEAEQRLLDIPLRTTRLAVVRPPLVYGPGVRGNFRVLLRAADSPWPLPLGRAGAPRSLVAVENLCDLLVRIGEGAAGVFHVADGQDFSVARLVAELRRLLGRQARQWSVSPSLVRASLGVLGRPGAYTRLFEPLRVDQAATRASLGWSPPYATAQALQRTVTWFRTSR